MAEQAKVTSIEALESFRSALIIFLTDSRRSLDEVGDAVRRTKQWLENDLRTKWEAEIRKRTKVLSEAQQELFGSKISNLKTASAQKEEAVRKARRAVAEAEEKLRNVKKWNKNYDSIVEPMIKQLEGLRGYLDHDVLRLTDVFNQLVLGNSKPRRLLRSAVIGAVTRVPRGRRLLGERLSGIGIAYPRQRGDDWMVGRRMPDIVCDGKRVYELLREAKFVLVTATPVKMDRPDIVHAVDNHPELPDAVLVRPDSYVAWASERLPDAAELAAAVDRWTRVT
jgi:DNA-binding Lrp family transcriptional regulator